MNEVNLEHASLDDAVQALKGAARGIVKIGVSKPLPVPDNGSSVEGEANYTYIILHNSYRSTILYTYALKNSLRNIL